MAAFRLTIEDGQFRDSYGRQVVLRGINVAGDAKLPSEPNQPSHVGQDFFDGDGVTFHQRPFRKEEASTHFARIRRYGFNTIRYVFTWEAIEAAGPGIYDEVFIRHTIDILRIARSFGFYVFMDPHQDVWSRFSGGSGAPMWTLYACGLNPQSFAATEAAIVQNTYPEPDTFPKMIWSTNYNRLAAATMFVLFFAGKDFAPKCTLDGVNIQDYLQDHFVDACAHLARRIHEAGDLEDQVVIGWESMNEPNRGLTGYADLTVIPKENPLKKGTCPTMWQALLTGMGRACEIDTWDMGGLGPYKTGTTLVDPRGEIAWLPKGYDDSRYGWKRSSDWRLGECLWAQHGVWDTSTDTIMKKDYFSKNPRSGKTIDYPEFTNTYFMDFWRKYSKACRAHHKNCIMLMQYPTLELPPLIKGTADDDPLMAFTPHFYDGITLMTKHWNSTWNVDVVGVLRGKYLHPAFAIKIGESAIRNCLRDQMATLRKEGLDRTGKHPCMLTEFGIPYDMDEKKAYKTGDYSSQSAALDANYFGVEGSQIEGHCLWVYTVTNDHERGDQWNGEDLSICSIDDKLPPLSPLPKGTAANQSTTSLLKLSTINNRDLGDDESVTPGNLSRTLTTPSIHSNLSARDPEMTNAPGYRAAEAFIRPTPTVVAGSVLSTGFDLRRCVYDLKISAPKAANADGPTVLFLPEYHFPKDQCEVTVSAGKWELGSDDDEGPVLQRLKWWHPEGEQTLNVQGVVRKHNVPEGSSDEAGYLEQCQQGYGFNFGNCTLM
ncbi:Glycoside hydrolase, superfamily [Moelleriella libera RCEF 2490]|uniref:Glycoside hydrolase, superfamily n=1 Tax=Moelleriella libera RCEF 2490 TaxID=1081109 RepID=A0A168AVC6_9HYPO|nr:Glycoside hydrolase, superfamily [Moelleriella libera RCEF 2490]